MELDIYYILIKREICFSRDNNQSHVISGISNYFRAKSVERFYRGKYQSEILLNFHL